MGASADDIALFSDGGGATADDIAMFSEPAHPIFGRPKMPEPKPDDELGIDSGPIGDYGKHDVHLFLQGKKDLITTPEARAAAKAREQREDPIRNDPLAGMIAQGMLAQGAGTLLAPAGRLISGAGAGAVASPDNPLTGAALGALPGVPAAARTADRAIGEAALNRALSRPPGSPPGPVAKLVGKGAGAVIGGATHGPLGLIVGQDIGGKAASAFSKAGDAATNALADRFLRQELESAATGRRIANLVNLSPAVEQIPFHAPRATGFAADAPPIPHRIPLAPLVPEGPTLPSSVPPGALGTPFLDEISGEPVTLAGQGGFLPEERATNAGARPSPSPPAKRLQIQDENGRDILNGESLRGDVVRDAKRFREQSGPDVDEPPAVPLESQLERSVRMLSELKSAARAGKVSTAMIQDALSAGMSPQAVAKTVGREAFDKATAK